VPEVEVFVDPSCPWAWITARWVIEVAPERALTVTWRSYCLEIRDEYGVAPTVPEHLRQAALAGHAVSHRMLRIFEAARARAGERARTRSGGRRR
jgi:predicted DsbA family dithiol-disulfide isomerase